MQTHQLSTQDKLTAARLGISFEEADQRQQALSTQWIGIINAEMAKHHALDPMVVLPQLISKLELRAETIALRIARESEGRIKAWLQKAVTK
jgi:hypothetical protein